MTPTYAAAHRVRSLVVTLSANSARRSRSAVFGMNGKRRALAALLLRRDQHVVHDLLAGWDMQAADPPGRLRQWHAGEILPTGVHDIWCREAAQGPWRLQLMLDDADATMWRSRRSPDVLRAVDALGHRNPQRWPYLTPEILLFYKAKPDDQLEKDELDFAASAPLLERSAAEWLDDALGLTLPGLHWRRALAALHG